MARRHQVVLRSDYMVPFHQPSAPKLVMTDVRAVKCCCFVTISLCLDFHRQSGTTDSSFVS